jgi:hypothetical protein
MRRIEMRPSALLVAAVVTVFVIFGLALVRGALPSKAQGGIDEEPVQALGLLESIEGTDADLWHLRVAFKPGTILEPGEQADSGTGHVEQGSIFVTSHDGTLSVIAGSKEPIISTDGSFECPGEELCEVPTGVQVVLGGGDGWIHRDARLSFEVPEQDDRLLITAALLARTDHPPVMCGGPCPRPPR